MPNPLARRTVGPFFVYAGLMHFLRTEWYVSIMPDYVPAHRELVYASGIGEMLGGAAVIASRPRFARWWLLATLVAVFPPTCTWRFTPGATRGSRAGRCTRASPSRGCSRCGWRGTDR